jgi:hypothetical protein
MAGKSETAASDPAPIDDQQVASYLQRHPEFLLDHPDLVSLFTLPARFDAGPVVDLQQHVINRLREELDQMRGCAEHLISTSRSNMSTQSRTHDAVLALLGAGSLAGLAHVVADDLPSLLDVDVAALGVESVDGLAPMVPGVLSMPSELLAQTMGGSDIVLRSASAGDPALFGSGAGLVTSYALVLLSPPGLAHGLLALGSREERGFHQGQGTELLSFLARVLENCVERWWPAG